MSEELKASREKYWEELDDSGKIERLREVIKQQSRSLENATKIVEKLRNHSHSESGRIMVFAFREYGEEESLVGYRGRDPQWF